MKYFGFMPNDFINGEGVNVSLWTAGCPHKCPGCHNSEMWEYENGHEVPKDLINRLIKAINANGIQRNFSVLGGEPMADYNIKFVRDIVKVIRFAYPKIKIFLWTGYTLEELNARKDQNVKDILDNIDVLIDGRFELDKRDITLPLSGSTNQRVLAKGVDF